jgi:hypothetical protein
MLIKFEDGTLGRFDFRGIDPNNYTLYIQLGEGKSWTNYEVFYKNKYEGNLEEINNSLKKFDITAEIIKEDVKFIFKNKVS